MEMRGWIITHIAVMIIISQSFAPLLQARPFIIKKGKSGEISVFENQEEARQERFKKNIINAPTQCDVIPGGYSQQIVLKFDRPLYCELEKNETQGKHVLVLKFPQMDENDFKATQVKELFSQMDGITSVNLSSLKEQGVNKVILTIGYNPLKINLKPHKAPKSKYLKVDAFSRAKLNELELDHHRMYYANIDYSAFFTVSPRRYSHRIVIDSGFETGKNENDPFTLRYFVLDVARHAQKMLKKKGHTVYLTHNGTAKSSFYEKMKRAKHLKGTLFVMLTTHNEVPLCTLRASLVRGSDICSMDNIKPTTLGGLVTHSIEASLLSETYNKMLACLICEGIEQCLLSSYLL